VPPKLTGPPGPHRWLTGVDEGLPRYAAIADGIAADIRSGILLVGDRLPPQRALARTLGVTLSTITEAYNEAARRHLVGGEVGRGTYVLAQSTDAALFASTLIDRQAEGRADGRTGDMIDLSGNIPSADPDTAGFATATTEIANGELDLAGYPTLTDLAGTGMAIAEWMRPRGVRWAANQLALTAGAQQALFVSLLVLARPGSTVLAEEHTFPGLRAVADQLQLRLIAIRMDEFGIDPQHLDRQARLTRATILVTVPCLQNPTGTTMDHRRRSEVAEVAARRGLTVIEDDVYGHLQDEPLLAPVLASPSVVVSSLSKTVAPGLRLGMIGGDHELIARINSQVQLTSWMLSPLTLRLARHVIESGLATQRLVWQRGEVLARWRQAEKHFGRTALSPAPHRWVSTGSLSSAEWAAEAERRGVRVAAGESLSLSNPPPRRVRLSLSAPRSRALLNEALSRLADLPAD
jgi:DNA-binding transcriptional MocR family regulator